MHQALAVDEVSQRHARQRPGSGGKDPDQVRMVERSGAIPALHKLPGPRRTASGRGRRLHCRQDTAPTGTPRRQARIHASGAGFPELFIFMSHPLACFGFP